MPDNIKRLPRPPQTCPRRGRAHELDEKDCLVVPSRRSKRSCDVTCAMVPCNPEPLDMTGGRSWCKRTQQGCVQTYRPSHRHMVRQPLGPITAAPRQEVTSRGVQQRDEWEDEGDPFNTTATGYLGRRRGSMLSNVLLDRAPVGRRKQCSLLPPIPEDFIYGQTTVMSLPMSDAICHQSAQERAKTPEKVVPDFLSLHRAAVTSGVTSAGQLRDFRNTHEFKLKLKESDFRRRADSEGAGLLPDASHTYGHRYSYQSTAAEVMSTKEQKDWIHCVKACRQEECEAKTRERKSRRQSTNTSELRRMANVPKVLDQAPLWRLPKFERKARPNICTFRSEATLKAAHIRSQSQC